MKRSSSTIVVLGLVIAAGLAIFGGVAYATENEPPGPPGTSVYRAVRATPSEVEITAKIAGGIFPGEGETPTDVLTLELPPGVYSITTHINVRKDFGAGEFICWTRTPTPQGNVIGFVRGSLGAEAGFVRRMPLSSLYVVDVSASGGQATLSCWQAANPTVPGSPSGENPTVFFANITATRIWRATITRAPSGDVTVIP
jgi:hypothetical protein